MSSTPEFVHISASTEDPRSWADRSYVPGELRDRVRRADVLLVPEEGFRGRPEPLYPVGTVDLYQFLRENSSGPQPFELELVVADEDYKELALHSALVIVATVVATYFVAPIIVNLISEYLKKRIPQLESAKETNVRFQLKITGGDEKARNLDLNYEGPANKFQEQMTEAIRAVAPSNAGERSEADAVTPALPATPEQPMLPQGQAMFHRSHDEDGFGE